MFLFAAINGQFFSILFANQKENILKSEADNRPSRNDLTGVYYGIRLHNKGINVFVPRKHVIKTYLITNVVCGHKSRRGQEKIGSNGHYSFPKNVSG